MTESEVQRILDRLDKLDENFISLRKYIVGDVKNGEETIGLAERVRKIEDWVRTRTWIERGIIAALIVETIAFVALTVQIVASHIQ